MPGNLRREKLNRSRNLAGTAKFPHTLQNLSRYIIYSSYFFVTLQSIKKSTYKDVRKIK